MNKKLLFGIMSLAALASCSTDDFESQKVAQQETSPVKFEVINNAMATRASMDGNKIVWSATDGDLFTLYHGGAAITGYENAIYTAAAAEGSPAELTTPSMIKAGLAVMVWPADTTFRIRPANNLSIEIPAEQKADIENYIPYMSDQITIGAYGAYNQDPAKGPVTAWNTEGKDRKYPVFMRPMASQLIVKADYAGTDATLASLYTGDDPIEEISVESVELLTKAAAAGGVDEFTTNLDVKWTAPTLAINAQWATVAHNAWTAVTDFGAINTKTAQLTTKCLDGNDGCKFLILPQGAIAGGVDDGAVVVNTIYGKVVVATPGTAGTKYIAAEAADAWYRFISAASKAAGAGVGYDATETVAATAGADGKFKTTSAIENGMMQTINGFSTYTATSGVAQGEPVGAAATRYVKVLLTHLDMSALHIKTDKQLRDAAKVWKQMNLDDVTVFLDGGATNGEFEISQTTIDKINEINASIPGGTKSFKVKPCTVAGPPSEVCNTIVITGGGNIKDLTFIKDNGGTQAAVAFKAGENWKWAANNTVKVANTACGISKFVNRGTFTSDATVTINVKNDLAVPAWVNIPFENAEGATWNISGATLNVQFNVTNYGTVNIAKGAQYRQDGNAGVTVFTNEATGIPARFTFSGAIPRGDDKVGTVWNRGVFATMGTGGTATINNYGLIEHADVDAKTYVTNNQLGGVFTTAFGAANKMGRINLPWNNKSEDNISVSAALNQGFISLTVDDTFTGETLSLATGTIGDKVNYLKVNSASVKEITGVVNQIDYLEVQAPNEVAWNVTGTAYNFVGLMVLSDVNVKLGTTINVTGAAYLGADMYVGGTVQYNGGAIAPALWSGYFGDTSANAATKYITY